MQSLIGLTRLTRHLGLEADSLDENESQRLVLAQSAATDGLERLTGRWLLPRVLSVTLTPLARVRDSLALPHDLLELLSVTDDGLVVPLDALEHTPDGLLRRTDGDAFRAESVTVRALWAYHPEPTHAWRDSATQTTSVIGELSPGVVVVGTTDSSDSLGLTPRFDVGHMMRLHDELMRVIAVNRTTHTLNFARAVNGSSAGHHDIGTLIHLYTPPHDLETLALRWAAWLYRQPDRPDHTLTPPDLIDAARAWVRVRVS